MIGGIDHLVLAIPDPDEAAASLEETLGLRASNGGRHERLGTFNRLVWLGDSYLELIGVFDASLAAETWIGRPVLAAIENGGGLATWAVATDDVKGMLRWTATDGALTGPTEDERHRPDGRVVRWRLAHPAEPSATSPFLIEHDQTAAEWTPEERRARALERHPIGATVRLDALQIGATAPAAAAGRLRSLLAITVEPEGRSGVKMRLGDQVVRFVAPAGAGAATAIVELTAAIPLRRHTARIGGCEVRLRGLPRLAPAATRDDGSTTGGRRV